MFLPIRPYEERSTEFYRQSFSSGLVGWEVEGASFRLVMVDGRDCLALELQPGREAILRWESGRWLEATNFDATLLAMLSDPAQPDRDLDFSMTLHTRDLDHKQRHIKLFGRLRNGSQSWLVGDSGGLVEMHGQRVSEGWREVKLGWRNKGGSLVAAVSDTTQVDAVDSPLTRVLDRVELSLSSPASHKTVLLDDLRLSRTVHGPKNFWGRR